ncbi:MAG TPA: hypothetical protein VHN14_15345 [Kofleriaceae bacterium]|jgi:hypothetical protein|nr:hypothetical protein [Kofleriaceae bacterium]
MAVTPQRRGRPVAIQELLAPQREMVRSRCTHCDRDRMDRDHELALAALRKHIHMLELKLYELEARPARTANAG